MTATYLPWFCGACMKESPGEWVRCIHCGRHKADVRLHKIPACECRPGISAIVGFDHEPTCPRFPGAAEA